MKIKNISCTQFAGVRNQNIPFTEGVNVIYGKNESGKSTIVNLISRTLFQKARLDGRSNKEFRDLYFPTAKKGTSASGDFADGKIVLETEKGEYTVSKEWGTEPRAMLVTPSDMFRDQDTVDSMLKDVLLYGEGVYTDMLLSSQRHADAALQTLLDASQRTDAKQEIVSVVSQAFAESDGVAVDEIETAINGKLEEIEGKHWDYEKEEPVRKAGRWSSGLGEILKAYYALEDSKKVLEEISSLEKEADEAIADYTKKDEELKLKEEYFNKFSAIASSLTIQSERKKTIARINKELEKIAEVLLEWPKLQTALEKASALQKEKLARAILEKYEAAKALAEEKKAAESALSNALVPTATEIMQVKTAVRGVASLENKLCGMNIKAAVKMLGGNSVEITSLRTGEVIALGETTAITEAVKITVPGVMEMQLSPASVDVAGVEAQIAEQKEIINKAFVRYKVNSVEELEELAAKVNSAKANAEKINSKLEMLLNGEGFEELEAKAKELTVEVRSKEAIEEDIFASCGTADVAAFVTRAETLIAGYCAEYASLSELKARAFDLQEEQKKAKESILSAEELPKEFTDVADPEAHLEALKAELNSKRSLREAALTAKTAAVSRLEGYKENLQGDPTAENEKAERAFEEVKSLLNHWKNIKNAFEKQKESMSSNPMQDIADSFAEYLGIISGGRIESEFPDSEKLNMTIYSNNSQLDFNKLSEGSKETVSLAFRLAVLDHLFPEGGGVIVFDDPFTDMDAERVEQSCKLITECAKKHQVIFLTCNEEYFKLLSGNEVRL